MPPSSSGPEPVSPGIAACLAELPFYSLERDANSVQGENGVHHHRNPEQPPVITVVAVEALVGPILHQPAPEYAQAGYAATGEGHQQAHHQVGDAKDKYYLGT